MGYTLFWTDGTKTILQDSAFERDLPNYFSSAFGSSFMESDTRVLQMSRSKLIFNKYVHPWLMGYTFKSLGISEAPKFEQIQLYEDAQFYCLEELSDCIKESQMFENRIQPKRNSSSSIQKVSCVINSPLLPIESISLVTDCNGRRQVLKYAPIFHETLVKGQQYDISFVLQDSFIDLDITFDDHGFVKCLALDLASPKLRSFLSLFNEVETIDVTTKRLNLCIDGCLFYTPEFSEADIDHPASVKIFDRFFDIHHIPKPEILRNRKLKITYKADIEIEPDLTLYNSSVDPQWEWDTFVTKITGTVYRYRIRDLTEFDDDDED